MTIEQYLRETLTLAANAHEYDMTHPVGYPPKPRVSCPTCGSDNSHRLWINFTERCSSNWHNNR